MRPSKPSLGLPFERTRLAGSTGHVSQLEHSPEGTGNDLRHQFCTQGPGQYVTMGFMCLTRQIGIDARGVRKRAVLDELRSPVKTAGGFNTHISTRFHRVEVDQISSVDGFGANGFVCLGFTVDTLDGRVNPQNLGNTSLQVASLAGVHKEFGGLGLIEENVGHVGKCWRGRSGFQFCDTSKIRRKLLP